jgi:uncharacterized membrane protein YgcG
MKRLFVVSVAAAAVSFPTAAGAATFKGIVVSAQPGRHALAVAQPDAVVRTVRVKTLRAAGTRVSVTAGPLRDGTFRAVRVRAFGRTTKARIHGTVVRAVRGGYVVSAGGSVLRILSPLRRMASAASTPLRPGASVNATVSIHENELQADEIEQVEQEPAEVEPAEDEQEVEAQEPEDQDAQEAEDEDEDEDAATTPTTNSNSGPGSLNSGPGSENSGPGSTSSGSDSSGDGGGDSGSGSGGDSGGTSGGHG